MRTVEVSGTSRRNRPKHEGSEMTMRLKLSIVACLTLIVLGIALIPALGQPGGPASGGPPMGPPQDGPRMDGPGGPGAPFAGGPAGPPPGGPMEPRHGRSGGSQQGMPEPPPPPPPGAPLGVLTLVLACLALVAAGAALTMTRRHRHGAAPVASLSTPAPALALAVVDGTVYVACADCIMAFAAGTLQKLAETMYAAPLPVRTEAPPPCPQAGE